MAAHFRTMGRANALPINLLGQAARRFTRAEQEDLIERLIEYINVQDGDRDIEPNGDELDGMAGEDDFFPHSVWQAQPGCPISDPDMGAEDYAFDPDEDMCAAGDDGCGPVLIHGRLYWGSATEAQGK